MVRQAHHERTPELSFIERTPEPSFIERTPEPSFIERTPEPSFIERTPKLSFISLLADYQGTSEKRLSGENRNPNVWQRGFRRKPERRIPRERPDLFRCSLRPQANRNSPDWEARAVSYSAFTAGPRKARGGRDQALATASSTWNIFSSISIFSSLARERLG